jgi:hypothetical protein
VTFALVEKNDFCDPLPANVERLVDWTVDLLEDILVEVISQPAVTSLRFDSSIKSLNSSSSHGELLPRSEVSATILLPRGNHSSRDFIVPPENATELDPDVKYLLRDFISAIASMHERDDFHAFEDAINVINATTKLLSTLIQPEEEHTRRQRGTRSVDRFTSPYSILSDPVVRFSMLFAALVHNLGELSIHAARKYRNKSVLEQCSVDVAWDLLTQPGYDDLRENIFRTDANLKRFRQILVNAVLATDIDDTELKASHDTRWRELFSEPGTDEEEREHVMSEEEECSCRSKLIIELVMQASKVYHYMQHWRLYLKRSSLRFNELYTAYKLGRLDKDPSTDLCARELMNFDMNIIPLAEKIKDCGVFGVSCQEMLDYALSNRLDWESRGDQIVKDWIEQHNSEEDTTAKKTVV